MEMVERQQFNKTTVLARMKQFSHILGILSTALLLLLKFMPGHNEVLQTRPASPPVKISSNGSKVFDSWKGSLAFRDVVLTNCEVALVFYYAPWSAEAMDAFIEYEAAAAVMYEQVSFISVNCWWIHGECRQSLEFPRFPHIYLHHASLNHSVLYHGLLTKENFLLFLKKALFPVQYLGTKLQVQNFLNDDQFSALSSYHPHAADTSRYLKRFLIVALMHLENNLLPINFGVVTDPAIVKAYYLTPGVFHVRNGMKPCDVIHLKLKGSFRSILGSLNKLDKQLISPDLHFPCTKTNFLHQTIHKGATLIVFLSSENVEEREKFVKKIRQLYILYRRCEKEQKSIPHEIYANSSLTNCCQTFQIISRPQRVTLVCSICRSHRNGQCPALDKNCWKYLSTLAAAAGLETAVCAEVPLTYGVRHEKLDVCCQPAKTFFREIHELNDRVLDYDQIVSRTRKLLSLQNGTDVSWIFSDRSQRRDETCIVSSLFCVTNRTLEAIILDYDRHRQLSENLGATSHVYNVGSLKLAAVIFDPKSDVNYAMTSPSFHLENFIIDYTLGVLSQNRRTSEEVDSCDSSVASRPCIHEVTAATFDEIVLNNDKNVLLLYYVPWCISCASMSHIYLLLADLLSPSSAVYLARIDAQSNELQLPFTVQSYPTFMFFPAKRSSYSVVFPWDVEITVGNLLSFLFEHMSPQSTKEVLLNLCMYASGYPGIQHAACRKWNLT